MVQCIENAFNDISLTNPDEVRTYQWYLSMREKALYPKIIF